MLLEYRQLKFKSIFIFFINEERSLGHFCEYNREKYYSLKGGEENSNCLRIFFSFIVVKEKEWRNIFAERSN